MLSGERIVTYRNVPICMVDDIAKCVIYFFPINLTIEVTDRIKMVHFL